MTTAIATQSGNFLVTQSGNYLVAPASLTPTPTFNPSPGSYATGIEVSITCLQAGATIYYTTDGTTPTFSSEVYSGPLYLTSTTTVKAVAFAVGFYLSGPAIATYTIY